MKTIILNMLPFTNQLGGTGYYIKRILYYLQKLDTSNKYILYFGNIENPNEVFNIYSSNFKIIKITSINIKLKRIIFEQLIFPFTVNKIKPDYFFSPSVVIPLLINPSIKTITTIHDLIPFVFPKKYSFFQRLYFNTISYISAKKADIILAVSENTKRDIIKYFKITNNRKIKVLYNFLDYSNEANSVISEKENFFITVSTIQPGKNLERLFRAFKKFRDTYNNSVKLFVIGNNGWNYQTVYNEVEALGLKSYIIFLGYIKETEIPQYYKKALGLIYVSYYEGFGIPPLEAMYFRCPVVVSNTSSLPEVVGSAGIFVDPYDENSIYQGMLDCFNKELVNEKIKNMPEQIKKFNGEREVLKLIEIFK